MHAKTPSPHLLIVLLIALLIVPTTAATVNESVEGDTHIITIYDEPAPMERVFAKPTETVGNMRIPKYGDTSANGINRLVVHRDIGDLDHIIFASNRIVPTGYNWVDQIPITVYWDPRHVLSGGFPTVFNGTYVGSGSIYIYSNSETQEGHMTISFDDWDSSIYREYDDIRIFCWIEAPRVLNFSTIAVGNTGSGLTDLTPINNEVVCALYGTVGISSAYHYGDATYVYTNTGVFEHRVEYSESSDEIVDVAIHKTIAGEFHQSTIKIFSAQHTDPYFTDVTLNELVEARLPRSESPFTLEIYSALTDRTYTTTLYGDSPTPPPTDQSAPVTVYIQNSQTGALLADASLSILAATGGIETEIINATLPAGTGTYTLQPTGGGSPNPDYYRAVANVPGFSQIIENHSFTLTGPHDVIIEMRPDSGGPTDPERCYLEYYVRDLAANPIPAASVQCGNQIRQTNSQGYAVFEVSKNASHPWIAKKSGYVTIEGSATTGPNPRYVVNVVLGPGTVPTYTPTPGPGETPTVPGATPTPDTRTNEQKGQAIIDLIADFAEPIALLAIVATVFGLMQMMMPRRR
jgi:hypothetical protein